MLALERGEKLQLPPAVWFQGRGDIVHDYKDAGFDFPGNEPQRFCRQLQEGRRRHRAANTSTWSATPAIRPT